ncbi:MAG: TrmH family RNA methyltransferase [Candidatus Krumholzibacteriia bacterium]
MNEPQAPRRLARAEAVLAARHRGLTVVLEDAHDSHNISAVLRTCEAFGIQDVHLVAELQSFTELNDAVTIGAHRWLTVHRHQGTENAIAALRQAGYGIFVSHLDEGATPLPALPRNVRAAYVFGNERSGVTRAWIENADVRFVIPTSGFSGSLNLSVAAALTIYDRLLGMPPAALPPGDLPAHEKTTLRAAWYRCLAGGSAELERAYRAYLENPPQPRPTFPRDHHRSPRRRPDQRSAEPG